MREKLIELLEEYIEVVVDLTGEPTIEVNYGECAAELIANGVTVQRWIPVTERLPTWVDGNKYGGILAVRRGHELSDFYHCNDVKENPDEFTHWMPLPTPPKDGE